MVSPFLRRLSLASLVSLSLAGACFSQAEEKPAAPKLIATSPQGDYALYSSAGALSVAPTQGATVPLPVPKPKPHTGTPAEAAASSDDQEEAGYPLAFISPDGSWIYAEAFGDLPARLYHRADAAGTSFTLAGDLGPAATSFFKATVSAPKLKLDEPSIAFAGWSGDSTRLLLTLSFFAPRKDGDTPGKTYAMGWLAYLRTDREGFEITPRLAAANRQRVNFKGSDEVFPPAIPVLNAEAAGQEGPEEPAEAQFKKADADLNTAYAALMPRLASPEQEQLRTEQRAWLQQRDAEAWIYAGQSFSPYFEASHVQGEAVVTAERTAELKARLAKLAAP